MGDSHTVDLIITSDLFTIFLTTGSDSMTISFVITAVFLSALTSSALGSLIGGTRTTITMGTTDIRTLTPTIRPRTITGIGTVSAQQSKQSLRVAATIMDQSTACSAPQATKPSELFKKPTPSQ